MGATAAGHRQPIKDLHIKQSPAPAVAFAPHLTLWHASSPPFMCTQEIDHALTK